MMRLLACTAAAALSVTAWAQPWSIEHTHDHVQGLDVSERWFWISAVDRRTKTGWIWRVDRQTLRTVAERNITDGARYHPGGLQAAGESVWVPLAEYRAASTARILELDAMTLAEKSSFAVTDHVGALATDGKSWILGANWDARKLYRWNLRGEALSVADNPQPLAIQDMKLAGGVIYAGGTGIGPEKGRCWVDQLDPATLAVVRSWTPGADRCYTNEGLGVLAGKFFFLPEDEPRSRVYVREGRW